MTSFIPAMIAVLFAEFGGRTAMFARLPRLPLAALLLGLAVGAAVVAGTAIAPTMPVRARTLLIGLALILTGCAQFGRASNDALPTTIGATILFVWRSSAPFLAFAFTIWKSDAIGAAAGVLAGIVAVVALDLVTISDVVRIWLRRIAGAAITVTGVYAALWALRLIA